MRSWVIGLVRLLSKTVGGGWRFGKRSVKFFPKHNRFNRLFRRKIANFVRLRFREDIQRRRLNLKERYADVVLRHAELSEW